MIQKMKIFLKNYPLEGYIWITALLILAIVNTESAHFTICPFHNLGIDICPGCGLGRSISHLIYFDFSESFNAHPFGGAALLVLLYRIFLLAKTELRKLKTNLSY
jgi:hypothetical protein